MDGPEACGGAEERGEEMEGQEIEEEGKATSRLRLGKIRQPGSTSKDRSQKSNQYILAHRSWMSLITASEPSGPYTSNDKDSETHYVVHWLFSSCAWFHTWRHVLAGQLCLHYG
jgi:hypothetical protein